MVKASPLIVAQLTDIHLFAKPDADLLGLPTIESFEAVLANLRQRQPQLDLLLLTGDLSQDETQQSYQHLYEKLKPLSIPTYYLPGNHDQYSVMKQMFQQPPFLPETSFAVGGWQFILLNSAVSGKVHGFLSSDALHWLDEQLKQTCDRPTLISLHHPPFNVNSDWIDKSKLQNSEEFLAILDRYSHVRLVVFGHIHQEFEYWRGGVRYLASPSTSIQFKPYSSKFALDEKEPGFRLLYLYPDGTFETQIERVSYTYSSNATAEGY